MNIREFTFNLKNVYDQMAETFSAYQSKTKLACLKSCGRCCLNPEVEASALEMLPLALKFYDEGRLDEWLLKLENSSQSHCLLFVATGPDGEGHCGSYLERPSVCRMFGVAGTFDKHHQVTLSICKFIREVNPDLPTPDASTPLIPDWSSKLTSVEPHLLQRKVPMNQAIKEAIEFILFYAQYQKI